MKHLLPCLIVVLAVSPRLGHSWGERGHMMINRSAAKNLPEDMPEFFRKAVDTLGFLAVQPDRWKSFNGALYRIERANHYLDMERLSKDFSKIEFPPDRIQYLRYLNQAGKKVKEVGLLPYQTLEYYHRLRGAFMEYRWALDDPDGEEYRSPRTFGPLKSIESVCIQYAGILGHYAGDSSQPLHATILYDGRDEKGEPKKTGVHIKFEVFYLNKHIPDGDAFADLITRPKVLGNILEVSKEVLVASNKDVDQLLTFDEKGRMEIDKADKEVIDFTKKHLARGSQYLLDLWYTAWVRSGDDLEAYRIRFKPKEKK
jgi:hypothetical protein